MPGSEVRVKLNFCQVSFTGFLNNRNLQISKLEQNELKNILISHFCNLSLSLNFPRIEEKLKELVVASQFSVTAGVPRGSNFTYNAHLLLGSQLQKFCI